MHYPLCVLVDLARLSPETRSGDAVKVGTAARKEALNRIEIYKGAEFECISGQGAGRYSNRYPSEMLGRDDPQLFLALFEDFKGRPLRAAISSLSLAREHIGRAMPDGITPGSDTDNREFFAPKQLSEVIDESMLERAFAAVEDTATRSYYSLVASALRLAAGYFACDCRFFSDPDNSSKVDPDTLISVRQNPENYALVFFDLHV